ncbi:MAG: ATP-binding protein [Planctomycetes bacterium]|nr:ATP-binding protein [Planctomycetota bacterium]
MPLEKEETASRLPVHEGPPPEQGETIFEREIPSDAALVTPLVVRAVEFLQRENLVRPNEESKVALCLEEALHNAVRHGNKNDFKKRVRLKVFLSEREWGAIVSDEGAGFDPGKVTNPLEEGLWGESGRGLYLIAHYMDRAEYFNRGNTVLMANRL